MLKIQDKNRHRGSGTSGCFGRVSYHDDAPRVFDPQTLTIILNGYNRGQKLLGRLRASVEFTPNSIFQHPCAQSKEGFS